MRVTGKNLSTVFAIFLAVRPACGRVGDDLLDRAGRNFKPLAADMPSPANQITPEKIRLGKALFYERRISSDGTVSCWKCHPISLYGADGLRTAIGNGCKVNPRNSPTIFNAAGQIAEHWVGNRRDVEDQARQSVTGPGSFNMPSFQSVEKALEGIPGYLNLFRKAFPDAARPVTIENFAKAIGAFERTLVTPSAFDAYLKGDRTALGDAEKRGLAAFLDTGCAGCHAGACVGGGSYQKFGVIEPYWKYTKSEPVDVGRFDVTKQESDKYVFKVPPLRNVDRTAPYFHDGSVSRLEEAVWIMAKVQLGKDPEVRSIRDIHSFLESLTGKIPDDALRVPVLPARE
jgi:cytochrome c peroxidase